MGAQVSNEGVGMPSGGVFYDVNSFSNNMVGGEVSFLGFLKFPW
jgi:hypothetical protein